MDQTLQVFITVAEHKNFTRAAEQLHMTQPAISHYIQTLEQTMGVKLLDRTNKYVRLNKAGEIVYYHAKKIMGLYHRMHSLVDDLQQTASGTVIIGSSYTFGEYILPHTIAYLHEHYPLIKPSIKISNTEGIIELVANHELDIGIIEGDIKNKNVIIEPFAEDKMYIIVPAGHRLVNRNQLDARELSEETWIVREQGSGTREITDKFFADFNIQPESLMEFGSTQVIKESVEAGLGITLLSHWTVRKELALGTMKKIKLQGNPVLRRFSIVTQNTHFQTRATEVFIEILRQRIGFNEKR